MVGGVLHFFQNQLSGSEQLSLIGSIGALSPNSGCKKQSKNDTYAEAFHVGSNYIHHLYYKGNQSGNSTLLKWGVQGTASWLFLPMFKFNFAILKLCPYHARS
jgi:hypothetical protein